MSPGADGPASTLSIYSVGTIGGVASTFCWKNGRRQGWWIGYEILKWQEKVIDDIEESLTDAHP